MQKLTFKPLRQVSQTIRQLPKLKMHNPLLLSKLPLRRHQLMELLLKQLKPLESNN